MPVDFKEGDRVYYRHWAHQRCVLNGPATILKVQAPGDAVFRYLLLLDSTSDEMPACPDEIVQMGAA